VASAIRSGDQIYRKLDRNPFNSRTVSPRTMSRVIFARLWPAPDDPRSALTWYQFQRLVRQLGAPPIRIAETCRIGVSGCRSALPGCLPRRSSGAGQGRCQGVRHVPQWSADASPSHPPAGTDSDSRREWIERGGHVSGRHDALPPGRRSPLASNSLEKRRRRGNEQHTGRGLPSLPRSSGPITPGVY
jgi:hypothetical protein